MLGLPAPSSSPAPLPSLSVQVTSALVLFLKHSNVIPTSGSLSLLCSPPEPTSPWAHGMPDSSSTVGSPQFCTGFFGRLSCLSLVLQGIITLGEGCVESCAEFLTFSISEYLSWGNSQSCTVTIMRYLPLWVQLWLHGASSEGANSYTLISLMTVSQRLGSWVCSSEKAQ